MGFNVSQSFSFYCPASYEKGESILSDSKAWLSSAPIPPPCTSNLLYLLHFPSHISHLRSPLFPFLPLPLTLDRNHTSNPHDPRDLVVNQRPIILLPSLDIIPHHTQNDNSPRYHDRVIHRRGRDGRRGRPDTPEDHKHHVAAGISVVDRAERFGKVPGPPFELGLCYADRAAAEVGVGIGGDRVFGLVDVEGGHGLFGVGVGGVGGGLNVVFGGAFGGERVVEVGVVVVGGGGGEVFARADGDGTAFGDLAFDSVVEEEGGGEEVGAVETGDGERDDVVEGGVRADVDEL